MAKARSASGVRLRVCVCVCLCVCTYWWEPWKLSRSYRWRATDCVAEKPPINHHMPIAPSSSSLGSDSVTHTHTHITCLLQACCLVIQLLPHACRFGNAVGFLCVCGRELDVCACVVCVCVSHTPVTPVSTSSAVSLSSTACPASRTQATSRPHLPRILASDRIPRVTARRSCDVTHTHTHTHTSHASIRRCLLCAYCTQRKRARRRLWPLSDTHTHTHTHTHVPGRQVGTICLPRSM